MEEEQNNPIDPFIKLYIGERIKEQISNNISKQIKSLKSNIGKLKNKIDIVENSDFQQQIFALDEKINKINKSLDSLIKTQKSELLNANRYSAMTKVNFDTKTMTSIIKDQLNNNQNLYNQVHNESRSVKYQILLSNDPWTDACDFCDRWEKILRDKGANITTY